MLTDGAIYNLCEIRRKEKEVTLKVLDKRKIQKEQPKESNTLCFRIEKENFEFIAQKATEIGASQP